MAGTAGRHRFKYMFPILFACFIQVAKFTYDELKRRRIGILSMNSTGGAARVWRSNITPSPPTFSIWFVIYALQVLFLLYSVSTLFRKGPRGYLYYSPGLLQPVVFYLFSMANVLLSVWTFVYDRTVENKVLLVVTAIILALVPFLLYICIGFTCYAVNKHHVELKMNSMIKEVWMVHFMVQNSLGMLATWTTIAAILNMGSAGTYYGGIKMETSSIIQLSFLLIEVLCYNVADIFFLDKFTRYLFTPQLVVLWAFAGSFQKNFFKDQGKSNATFIAVLLALAAVAMVIKLVAMIVRSIRSPLYTKSFDLPRTNLDVLEAKQEKY